VRGPQITLKKVLEPIRIGRVVEYKPGSKDLPCHVLSDPASCRRLADYLINIIVELGQIVGRGPHDRSQSLSSTLPGAWAPELHRRISVVVFEGYLSSVERVRPLG